MSRHNGVGVRLAAIALVLLPACGGSSPAPAPAPALVAAGGTWAGTVRIRTVTGGECGESLQYLVNSTTQALLTLQQNGAEVTGQASLRGATCTLQGSATTTGVSLNSTRCEHPPNVINFTVCSPGGGGRDLITPRSLSMTLGINGSSASGQFTEVWDVRPVGGAVTSSTTMTGDATLARQ